MMATVQCTAKSIIEDFNIPGWASFMMKYECGPNAVRCCAAHTSQTYSINYERLGFCRIRTTNRIELYFLARPNHTCRRMKCPGNLISNYVYWENGKMGKYVLEGIRRLWFDTLTAPQLMEYQEPHWDQPDQIWRCAMVKMFWHFEASDLDFEYEELLEYSWRHAHVAANLWCFWQVCFLYYTIYVLMKMQISHLKTKTFWWDVSRAEWEEEVFAQDVYKYYLTAVSEYIYFIHLQAMKDGRNQIAFFSPSFQTNIYTKPEYNFVYFILSKTKFPPFSQTWKEFRKILSHFSTTKIADSKASKEMLSRISYSYVNMHNGHACRLQKTVHSTMNSDCVNVFSYRFLFEFVTIVSIQISDFAHD